MEMLVYTEPGKIELLPAWPKEYADGKLTGIRMYGGHVLNLEWKDGQLLGARLKAHQDETLQIHYRGKEKSLQVHKGQMYQIAF